VISCCHSHWFNAASARNGIKGINVFIFSLLCSLGGRVSVEEMCIALQAGIALEGEIRTEKGMIRVKRRIGEKLAWDVEYEGDVTGSGDIEENEDGKYWVSFTVQKKNGVAILVKEAKSLKDAIDRIKEVAEE
jgi:hypothetical protein